MPQRAIAISAPSASTSVYNHLTRCSWEDYDAFNEALRHPAFPVLASLFLGMWMTMFLFGMSDSATVIPFDIQWLRPASSSSGRASITEGVGQHVFSSEFARPPVCLHQDRLFGREDVHNATILGTGGDLPTVVLFVGVEGSGHKFFEQVFVHLPSLKVRGTDRSVLAFPIVPSWYLRSPARIFFRYLQSLSMNHCCILRTEDLEKGRGKPWSIHPLLSNVHISTQ